MSKKEYLFNGKVFKMNNYTYGNKMKFNEVAVKLVKSMCLGELS